VSAVVSLATIGLALALPVSVARGTTTAAVAFNVVTSNVSRAAVPGSDASWAGQGYPGERYPYVPCQWPPSRASITVAEAATYRCSPSAYDTTHFPVPASGSFEILSTPIDGAPYSPQNGGLSDNVRFVTRDGPVIHVGPSLLEYGDYSGGARPSFAEAGGTLWIFDYATERGPEVIRISATTGAVLQRTVMPAISRPIIGVNALGFWLAQDSDSLCPNSQVRLGVWFAAVGATRGELVKASRGSVWAMRADGDAMDVFVSPHWRDGDPAYQMWRFTPS